LSPEEISGVSLADDSLIFENSGATVHPPGVTSLLGRLNCTVYASLFRLSVPAVRRYVPSAAKTSFVTAFETSSVPPVSAV
jgi:hypothetical protein